MSTFGHTVAVIQKGPRRPDDSRVYYQKASDGAIYERLNATNERLIVPGNIVRAKTPLAAIALNNFQFDDIRVYYINKNNRLSEMMYRNGIWKDGGMNEMAYEVVEDTNFLYASGPAEGGVILEIGFISAKRPNEIMEAVYVHGRWSTRQPLEGDD